jgi:alpha(1,3/1,4) fucosyltransferase
LRLSLKKLLLFFLVILLVCSTFFIYHSYTKENTVYIASGIIPGPFGEKGDRKVVPLCGYYLPELFAPYHLKVKAVKSYKRLSQAKKIILFDLVSDHNLDALSKISPQKLSLFLWEPPSTIPENYDKKTHELFSRIYTWDDDLVDNKKYFKFYYPNAVPMIENIIPFAKRKFCTLIGRNKKSRHPNELYSEREKVIQFFEKEAPEDFDLYGEGWQKSGYKTYQGAPLTKECLREYKFNFAYENLQHIKGYITEKIFESFYYGCVPIYWGAENIDRYIPENCYIDRRKFSSNEELYAFLKTITEKEYEAYLENIRAFLKSDKAKLFTGETFIEIFKDAAGTNEKPNRATS